MGKREEKCSHWAQTIKSLSRGRASWNKTKLTTSKRLQQQFLRRKSMRGFSRRFVYFPRLVRTVSKALEKYRSSHVVPRVPQVYSQGATTFTRPSLSMVSHFFLHLSPLTNGPARSYCTGLELGCLVLSPHLVTGLTL